MLRPRSDAGRSRGSRAAAAAASLIAFALTAPVAVAQSGADLAPCVPDGTVDAITHANGNTYIGGQFGAVGQRSGPGVPLAQAGAGGGGGSSPCGASTDPEAPGPAVSGQPIRPFPEVSGGKVYAALADGGGGWYIGGTFTSVGGQPRDRLAHIRPDGTVASGIGDPTVSGGGQGIECNSGTTSGIGAECAVHALALQTVGVPHPVLYVGGSFDGLGSPGNIGAPQPDLAAIDAGSGASVDGGTQGTNWAPPSPNGVVNALAVVPVTIDVSVNGGITVTPTPMSIVVLGGTFTAIGGGPTKVNELGAVWGVGAEQSCESCSTASPTPVEMGGAVVQSGPGASSSGSGWASAASSFSPSSNPAAQVSAIAVGQPTEHTRFSTSTPCQQPAATTCDEYIPVYVGGDPASGVALQAFELPIVTANVASQYSMAPPGTMETSNNVPYSSWNVPIASGSDSQEYANAIALSPVPDLTSLPVAAPSPPTVYFGGDFAYQPTTGATDANLAAVEGIGDPNGSSQTASIRPWAPTGSGSALNGPVNALAVKPGAPDTVYAGGDFTDACSDPGSSLCNYVAAFDGVNGQQTSPISTWVPSLAGGDVDTLALDPSSSSAAIYAGGAFASTGAVARHNLAALDASGNLLAWNPGASIASPSSSCGNATSTPQVDALAASGSTIYAGGVFDTAGGSQQCNLAALDASSGQPAAGFAAPNPDGAVLALSSTGNALYAGGRFTQIGGQSRNAVAKLDPASGAVDAQWNPSAAAAAGGSQPASVDAIAAGCGTVYVGGDFATVGGKSRGDLAAVDATNGAATTWNPDAASYVYAIQPAGNSVYVAGNFSSVGGAGGPYVAALDVATGKAATGFTSAAHYTVPALAVAGSTLYLGQSFGGPGDTSGVQNLIAVQGDPSATDSSGTSTWGQPLDSDINSSTGVNADAPFDPYTTAYPDPDGNGDIDTPAPGGDVLALSAYGQTLYLGGDFTSLGTRPQEGFAAIPLSAGAGTAGLTCTTPRPAVQISGSGAFGSQPLTGSTTPHTFTITNSGTASLVIPAAGVALVGADSGQYLETADGCSGQAVAPGGSCAVQVSFAPRTAGPHDSASLQVIDNAPGSPQAVPLSGSGAPLARARRRIRLTLTDVRQSHRRWREPRRVAHAARRRTRTAHIPIGTTFSFKVNERARVTLVFTQRLPGRKHGRRCLPVTARNRRRPKCTRTVTAGTMSVVAKAGKKAVRFNGRLSRKRKLKPGVYTVYIVATDSSGQRTSPRRLTFTIVP